MNADKAAEDYRSAIDMAAPEVVEEAARGLDGLA